jgi:hypothetical protein
LEAKYEAHINIDRITFFSVITFAQTETLTNTQIVDMIKAGLSQEIILNKIKSTSTNFDISTNALIDLKGAGVGDAVITQMIETAKNLPAKRVEKLPGEVVTPKGALLRAKTIAITKLSLHPSRQALEKELMKRTDWKQFNLSLESYKESADLYIDIGYVHLSILTHRYVYRVYDRRSGIVVAAGETTSWGSLSENLARNICHSLAKVMNEPST